MGFLLGFDTKERGERPAQHWTTEKREAFLFRLDVEPPLTIDSYNSFSLFEHHPNLLPEQFDIVYPSFWDSLEYLDTQLQKITPPFPPYLVVAVTLIDETLDGREKQAFEEYLKGAATVRAIANIPGQTDPETWVVGLASPDVLDQKWKFLGYDIADLAETSGLTNCSIEEGKKVEHRSRWGGHLNRYHLFEDFSQAQAFKDYCNQSVPEHAPFFVFGLWLIREVQGSDEAPATSFTDSGNS